MRRLEFLSPTAQALLRHVKSLEAGDVAEFAVPQILIDMRRKGFSIDKTLSAMEECGKAQWLIRSRVLGDQPGEVTLTRDASLALNPPSSGTAPP